MRIFAILLGKQTNFLSEYKGLYDLRDGLVFACMYAKTFFILAYFKILDDLYYTNTKNDLTKLMKFR